MHVRLQDTERIEMFLVNLNQQTTVPIHNFTLTNIEALFITSDEEHFMLRSNFFFIFVAFKQYLSVKWKIANHCGRKLKNCWATRQQTACLQCWRWRPLWATYSSIRPHSASKSLAMKSIPHKNKWLTTICNLTTTNWRS